MKTWWDALPLRSRVVLAVGAAAAAVVLALGGWWAFRTEQAVLFSDLRPQDAALMAGELDKLKVPYALADNGATLLVDKAQVPTVRLKLMGKELPLHGTVGFELFNNADFGMTEFAQKINYQRALQGELTRTILSFPEIRDVRVHLALPEQGLFRQNAARPKAAVTVHLRQGQSLRGEQVGGIQRLVAAAVPGLTATEVTIVDQQGVALSRGTDSESEPGTTGRALELKRETETYLARKAANVLDKAFGPGQALASVDVTLNMDQVRVTTEDVIGAPERQGGAITGVLVRERESSRDNAPPDARNPDTRMARGSSSQRDVEYQPGRRVEQVVSQPGAIRRIQVVAVVRQKLAEEERQQLQRVMAAAVGASLERGDTVVVQHLQPAAPESKPAAVVEPPAAPPAALPARDFVWAGAFILAVAGGTIMLQLARRRRRTERVAALTQAQRQAALRAVRGWMLEAAPVTSSRGARGGGE